jgi:hypothetical protein
MNKKLNRNSSAGTAADSDKMPKLTTSCHHIAKPNVSGSFVTLDINKANTELISTNKTTCYVIGIGETNYTIHKDADDIEQMYFDKTGFFKNFNIIDFHSYHVFCARIKSICGYIKYKKEIKYKGQLIKIKRAYIGIPNVCELIYNEGGRKTIDYLTFKGIEMSKINKRLVYVIEVA